MKNCYGYLEIMKLKCYGKGICIVLANFRTLHVIFNEKCQKTCCF